MGCLLFYKSMQVAPIPILSQCMLAARPSTRKGFFLSFLQLIEVLLTPLRTLGMPHDNIHYPPWPIYKLAGCKSLIGAN